MNQLKFKSLLLTILYLGAFNCVAQNIHGSVKSQTGEAIPFASISALNTSWGTASDNDGNFSLNLTKGTYQISISAVGYASKVEPVVLAASTVTIDVVLQENTLVLGELVVSANKSEETVQTTPAAVSVLNAKQIQETRTWNTMDMTGIVPNLFAFSDGAHYMYFTARGVTAYSYDPAVQMYIDDVPQFSTASYNTPLADVSSLEFLRGPQGTLYGRNAMGGVINIVTRKPTDIAKGNAEISFGNFGQQRYGINLSTPLVKNKLYAGITGTYDAQDGYLTNTFLNNKTASHKITDLGLNLKYLINDKWSLALNARYDRMENKGLAIAASDSLALANDYTIEHNDNPVITRTVNNISMVAKYHGDMFNFTSVTAYNFLGVEYKGYYDYDYTRADLYAGYYEKYGKPDDGKNYYQELRFSSSDNNENKLQWIGGAMLFTGRTTKRYTTYTGVDADPEAPYYNITATDNKDRGLALFGQVKYDFTRSLFATAGLRYDVEHRQLTRQTGFVKEPNPVTMDPAENYDGDFSALTPKLTISYQVDEMQLLYGGYTRGFRAGGTNYTPIDEYRTYKPENSNNFEVGYKLGSKNGKFRMNTALFYTLIDDIQAYNTFDLITFEGGYTNVGNAISRGVEVELTFIPLKGLRLRTKLWICRCLVQGLHNL